MQAGDSAEQIKGMYLTQITEDGELAVLSRKQPVFRIRSGNPRWCEDSET